MEQVILLNNNGSFLRMIDWQRAVCLIVKDRAIVVSEFKDKVIRTAKGFFMKVPMAIKLLNAVRKLYKSRVPYSKRNVMIRDKFTCAYCGSKKDLTIDHIIPKSRGGKSTFDNCVTSCKSCNNHKGDRTPREANMFIRTKVFTPTIHEFTQMKIDQLGIRDLLNEIGGW